MNDTDKVKMILNIGGEHLTLSVDFNRQDAVRDAEKIASDKFKEFKLRFPSRDDREILAMVAYEIAYYYQDLFSRHMEAVKMAEEVESHLEAILAERPGAEG